MGFPNLRPHELFDREKKGDRSEGRRGIKVRAALLRVKIYNSDSKNSRLTSFDWHNFIRTCIKYEILLKILFF